MGFLRHRCVTGPMGLGLAALVILTLHPLVLAQKSVGQAWRDRTRRDNDAAQSREGPSTEHVPPGADVIAYVGRRPITRDRLMKLLLKGHGAALLEQLIVLEAAESVAEARGIHVTSADIEAEYDRSLHALVNPTGLTPLEEFNRTAAEAMLAGILADRNISREEYGLGVRRNALLRKICDADLRASEAEIQQQHERDHGEKVRIRRIVVSTSTEAQSLLRQMAAGVSFDDLARRFNVSPSAAARDGLMLPFTRAHDEVPPELRATAFSTPLLEVSAPFEIDGVFNIIRVEEKTPADTTPIASVRARLIDHWKQRMLPGRMQALYRRLLTQTETTIVDPALRKAYRDRRDSTQ